MEFLRRANPLPPLPLPSFSGLPPPPPPRLLRLIPLPWGRLDLQLSVSPASPPRHPRGSANCTHPARHLRGHVRLRHCSSALCARKSPPPPRARPLPALAQARSRLHAAHALRRVSDTPALQCTRGLDGSPGWAGRWRHFERELPGAVGLVGLSCKCLLATFFRAPFANLITTGRLRRTL